MSDRLNQMSVNLKKISAKTSVNRLVMENYRSEENAEKYDDGHRMIDIGKTGENVYLIDPPENYDQIRRDRIARINEERARRIDLGLRIKNNVERLKDDKALQAAKSREAAQTRKLRADTVDTIGIVVQMPPDMAEVWSRDQQTQFFRDCLDYMRQHPEEYGQIDTAVIHYDEHSPHMQCLATALDMQELTSRAGRIVGNKTKMSNRQTHIAEAMQAKGWDVDRGLKRVNNPEYTNFKDDMKAWGIKVNRHNDRQLMDVWREIKNQQSGLESGWEALRAAQRDFNARIARIDQIKAEAKADRQKAAQTLSEAQKRAQEINAQSDTTEKDLKARTADLDARESALKPREENLNELMEQAKKDKEAAEAAKQELADKIAEAREVAGGIQTEAEAGLKIVNDLRKGIKPETITPKGQARRITSKIEEGNRIAREMLDMTNSLDDLTPDQQGQSL